MGTIITDEEAPVGSAGQEASYRQLSMISRLLDTKWVSEKCASRIINLLSDQPAAGTDGMEDLKDILRK